MSRRSYEVLDCARLPALIGSRGLPPPQLNWAWRASWDQAPSEALGTLRNSAYHFETSGSTGTPTCWTHSGANLIGNAEALIDAVGPDFDAVVCFAPPQHVFGACSTIALPAVFGKPMWFWGGIDCAPPPFAGERVLVVAIPWTFALLRRHLGWLRSQSRLAFLHSTAALPAEARVLRQELADSSGMDVELTEVLGSTETGAVAFHPGWDPATPWTACRGVTVTEAGDVLGHEKPLRVTTPWMARTAEGDLLHRWETGDLVEVVDESRFLLRGRIGRLLKINGRRIDLTQVEHHLRAELTCSDVACVPTHDVLRGESFNVLVAGATTGVDRAVRAILARLELAPHRVEPVVEIQRSATGKLLARQTRKVSDENHSP